MKINKFITLISGFAMFMLLIISCNDSLDKTIFLTTDDLTITQTLEANPELFSSYLEILHKTDFYNSLRSYGNYTCFVPTNTAIKTYLNENWNVDSIDELNSDDQIEFLKILVKFHTLPSARTSPSFIEGRLTDTTYTGDFLTTSFLQGGGISNVQINREVGLDQYDIGANNGVIHAINGVLSPYIDGVPKVMENAGNHTIFVEALKQTGYYETFSVIFSESGSKNNFTILAESDLIYNQEGINSFADLANLISPDNSDYTDPNNELNRFIAYHATQSFLYSSDFPEDGFINTILPRNAIKSFKTDKLLKLNETETGVDDTWTSLISEGSNFPAKNGVYHTVDKLFTVFVPKAKYVLFDFVGDQPEVQSKLIATHVRVPSTSYEFIRWFPEQDIRYLQNSSIQAINYNVYDISGVSWIEFDTPVLPKGQYEVVVCSKGSGSSRGVYQIVWDGEPLGAVYDIRTYGPNIGWPDEVLMEANGWRPGLKEAVDGSGDSAYDSPYWLRFVVTKNLLCPIQDRHVIRFETVKGGGMPLDFVEFIPVE